MALFDFFKKKPADPSSPPSSPSPSAGPDCSAAAPPSEVPASVPTTGAQPTAAAAGAANGEQESGSRTQATSSPASSPAAAEPPTHIEATDAFGRRVQITREEYRKKVLPDLIKAHGSDPDRLVAVIMQALRDGCAVDVIAAANRLTVVDKNLERALSVLAVVQRDAGELDDAEATLKELQQKRPQSPAANVGLGMLAERRGDVDKAQELLWQALQQDCNHADAVHGYLQLRHRAVGDDGYLAEIEQVAALPGSWRAQLWQARFLLSRNESQPAASIYREVLSRTEIESDALVMAAADLVQSEQHDLVEELVAARFQPGRHHPHAGTALLHHYHKRQDHAAGTALLHQMHVHYGHLIGADLQPFTAAFDRMRLQQLPPPAPLSDPPRVGLYRLDRPIWCAGYDDPQWLLPPKAPGHKHVMLFALAMDPESKLPPGREDELGRWTRNVPLWFAEQIWLATPHRGTAALPMAENGGWAVMGRPWPEEQLTQQVPENERADTVLVTGQLRLDGDRRRVDLWAYDCGTKQRIGHAAAEGSHEQFGDMLLQLMGELWPMFGGPKEHRPQVGDGAFWQRYADGLGQHAALVVTLAGGMPRERLYGERYITQWLQNAALSETRWQPGFWLLGSALSVLKELGSPVPLEHARMVAEIFRQSPPTSAFARLAIKPLLACGLEPLWQGRRDEIRAGAGGDARLLGWLQKAEQPLPS